MFLDNFDMLMSKIILKKIKNFDVLMSKIIFKKIKKYQLQHVKNQLILYIEKSPAQRAGKSARLIY